MWVKSLTAGRLVTRWYCPTIDKYFTSLPLPAFTQGKRTVFSQNNKPSLTNLSEGSSQMQALAHRPWTMLQEKLHITQSMLFALSQLITVSLSSVMYPHILCLGWAQAAPTTSWTEAAIDFLLCGGWAYNFRISQDIMVTDWCWSCVSILSRLSYTWVWNNSEQHLEIQPFLLKCSREICNLYQGAKSLDIRWFKQVHQLEGKLKFTTIHLRIFMFQQI